MERVIGIDLGTTNSVVAYYEQGQPVVIQNAEGSKTTPSVVHYKGAKDFVVGELAKRQAVILPQSTIRSVKRFMGCRFSEVGQKLQGITYPVVPGDNDSLLIDIGSRRLTPEQVSAEVLVKMRETAEHFFGEEVERAVVTVPAYFNDNQRQATKRAGEMAGLEVLRIINEPTAAALAYGVDKNVSQRVAVFDFGGGTFDVSVLELNQDVFEVRSTRGDTFLGGDNIDQLLMEDLIEHFGEQTGVDLRSDLQAVQRVAEAAERAKCELSTLRETLISLPFLCTKEGQPLHLNRTYSRERFQDLIMPMVPALIDCCDEALKDAGLKASQIDQVLLVGGSTRIPAVQEAVRAFFGKEPNKSLNPDEAVAIGAAIQGAIMTGALREVLLLDVTPLSLGIEVAGGVFSALIPRNSSVPAIVHKNFTTVKDKQSTVRIHVLQGERKIAAENHSLSHFRLTGINPAPAGIPSIDVAFHIDPNGILQVSATDVTSGASHSVTIESYSSAVGEEDVRRMVQVAEEKVAEDKAYMRMSFLRQQGDDIVLLLSEILQEEDDPLDKDTVVRVKEAMFTFDVAVAKRDPREVEIALDRLRELSDDLGDRVLLLKARREQDSDDIDSTAGG